MSKEDPTWFSTYHISLFNRRS